LVEQALCSRGVEASEAAGLYLVSILSENARSASSLSQVEQPFAIRLANAMSAKGGERFTKLRSLGDDALFLRGFFSEHLSDRGLPEDYVNLLGQTAYSGAASVLRSFAKTPAVFEELSAKFENFVSLLQHIADSLFASTPRDNLGVLELYERWQRTRSDVLAHALVELGVMPTRGQSGSN
jgi:hypothetical protein